MYWVCFRGCADDMMPLGDRDREQEGQSVLTGFMDDRSEFTKRVQIVGCGDFRFFVAQRLKVRGVSRRREGGDPEIVRTMGFANVY